MPTGERRRGPSPRATVAVALLGGLLVLVATRKGPLLSPDSITYLSAAQHLRAGERLTDFTGRPLAVFGPLYPILLSVGGRSLLWARLVGASAATVATALMIVLLRRRVPLPAALVGGAAFAASQGLVNVASTVWSESPYLAIALGMLVILTIEPLTPRRAAIGGLLAGCGFLTRYAGAGLILTGAVIIGVASLGHDRLAARHLGPYGAAAFGTSALWMARNTWTTGEPLGPRFSGGAHESVRMLTRRTILSVGQLVDDRSTPTVTALVGVAAVAVVAVATIVVVRRRPLRTADVGVLAFAWSSLIVPIVARVVTASDISPRVMSPMLVPLVYLAVVAIQRAHPWRPAVVAGVVLSGWWMYQGATAAQELPNAVIGAGQARIQAAPELYRLIADLPPTATVLTNNPHSVWWLTGREPTLFAFTRPRAGNSHYPLSATATLTDACRGPTYLAWFERLGNAGKGPGERRPDLTAIVRLTVERQVPGGALYRLTARDAERCPPP